LEKSWIEKITENLLEYMSKATDKIEEFSTSMDKISKVKEEPLVEDTCDLHDRGRDAFEALEYLYWDSLSHNDYYCTTEQEKAHFGGLTEEYNTLVIEELRELEKRREFDKPVQFAMDIHTGPYCPECGSKVRWYSNGYQQKFCSQCGKPIKNDRGCSNIEY
jgi:NADH pyrophosphatase NudC (nudix superfamily)